MGLPQVARLIIYNGSAGGLGRFMAPTLACQGLDAHALSARLEDSAGLQAELATLRPQADPAFVLMAARVSVPACEADPEGTHHTNVICTADTAREFVSWARERSLEPRLIYVSTGHVYAEQPTGSRLKESAPTAPRSVYAGSKLQAETTLGRLAREMGFTLIIARVFGLVAPTQPPNYLLPGLIDRVRTGQLDNIPGLSYVRDYLDARDVCRSLLALASPQRRGGSCEQLVVNVCSGEAVTIREVLRTIVRIHKPDDEGSLMALASEAPGRPDDIAWIVGDPSTFVGLTGTPPRTIPLERTAKDALASG